METVKEEKSVYNEFDKVNHVQPFAEISVNLIDGTDNQFIIESRGIIGQEHRTVSNSFHVEWEEKYREIEKEPYELPPFAVFTAGNLTMTNGTINGDIGTVSQSEGAISFPSGGPTHNGSIYVPDGDQNIVNNEVANIQSEIKSLDDSYLIPELPPFPDFPLINTCPSDK